MSRSENCYVFSHEWYECECIFAQDMRSVGKLIRMDGDGLRTIKKLNTCMRCVSLTER
jgi:hypothetical protein